MSVLKWIRRLFKCHQAESIGDERTRLTWKHSLAADLAALKAMPQAAEPKQSASIEPDKPWPRMREMTPDEVRNVHRHGSNPLPPGSKPTATLALPPAPWPELPPLQHDMDYRALLLAYMTRVLDCEGISFLDANGRHSPLTDAQMDALMVIEAEASASLQA